MKSRLFLLSHPLSPLLWERSLAGVVRYLARALTAPLYSRRRQYITLKRLDGPDAGAAASGTASDGQTECLVVDSAEALQAMAPEILPVFRDSVDELAKRVAQGCVLCVARRPREDGAGQAVIGYEIAEPGVFSAFGRCQALSAEVIFSHYVEVLPRYRGQRIHGALFATRDAYFRRRGGKILCGVVDPRNHASLRALGRAGSVVVGTVEHFSLFGGLFVWDTPLERIENALQASPRRVPPAG